MKKNYTKDKYMNSVPTQWNRSKIIATLGPSCNSYDTIKEMVLNGVRTVRLNFSHGDRAYHESQIATVRAVEKDLHIPISIMLDTKGPEIRVGKLQNNQLKIGANDLITIYCSSEKYKNYTCSQGELTISDNVSRTIQQGAAILVDDGKLVLNVESVAPDVVRARALNNHIVLTNKRVNLPGTPYSLPFLSDRDKADILFGLKKGINYIAASFTNSAEDIELVRTLLRDSRAEYVQIIAKIESSIGMKNLDEIIKAADGCMVARGDLALEVPYYNVPIYQKRIIRKCRKESKLVIVATQMLESMISIPTPTRAEVSDVFFAVEGGADATMLSGESAMGEFPVRSVAVMQKIAGAAEKQFYSKVYYEKYLEEKMILSHTSKDPVLSLATELVQKTRDGKYPCIILLACDNNIVRKISALRPNTTIIGITDNIEVYRSFGIMHSVLMELCPTQKIKLLKSMDPKMLSDIVAKHTSGPGTSILVIASDLTITELPLVSR